MKTLITGQKLSRPQELEIAGIEKDRTRVTGAETARPQELTSRGKVRTRITGAETARTAGPRKYKKAGRRMCEGYMV